MGRDVGEGSDFKSQLVTEICSISSRSITSSRKCPIHPLLRPHFIDWYLLLRVEEDAHIDIIRKQYRKLALQLHPDKNKHPKAEVAFRLVSEAYACLSDKAKRSAFDSQRCNNFCKECSRISSKTSISPADRVRSNTILHQLREVRERFREEAKVIENCLKVNKASSKEFPLFEPSEYLLQKYPHCRRQTYSPENFRYLQVANIRNDQRRGKCESPIFEIGTEGRSSYLRSAYLSS